MAPPAPLPVCALFQLATLFLLAAALLGVGVWGIVALVGARESSCCLPPQCARVADTVTPDLVAVSAELCNVGARAAAAMGCSFEVGVTRGGAPLCNTTSAASCFQPRGASAGIALAAAICGAVAGLGVAVSVARLALYGRDVALLVSVLCAAASCALAIAALNRKGLAAVAASPAVAHAGDGAAVRFDVCGGLSGAQAQLVEVTTPTFTAPLAAAAALAGAVVLGLVAAVLGCDVLDGGPASIVHRWWRGQGSDDGAALALADATVAAVPLAPHDAAAARGVTYTVTHARRSRRQSPAVDGYSDSLASSAPSPVPNAAAASGDASGGVVQQPLRHARGWLPPVAMQNPLFTTDDERDARVTSVDVSPDTRPLALTTAPPSFRFAPQDESLSREASLDDL
jgi:hypothetical protein